MAAAGASTGRLVLITGGSRGIGRILARGFAAAGHPVALTATHADRAQQAAAEIRDELAGGADAAGAGDAADGAGDQSGAGADAGAVFGFGLDVSDPDSVDALRTALEDCCARHGLHLGVLINNAGRIETTEGPLWQAEAASLIDVVSTNVIGPLLMIRAFAPVLMSSAAQTGQPGRIIDLNSGSGAQGTPAYAAYSASKAALFRIADSVVHYGHEAGLRIFELSPGVIRSDMTTGMPMHDWRSEADWTTPAELTALALAIAEGQLDAWTGRYLRAGQDTPETLAAHTPAPGSSARKLSTEMDLS